MSEIERNARLLCRADGWGPEVLRPDRLPRWKGYEFIAEQLVAAGLTLARLEPDEATVDRMADAVMRSQGYSKDDIDFYGDRPSISPVRQAAFEIARAAYRAAVKGEE